MDGQTSTSSSHQSLRRPRAGLPTEGGDASAGLPTEGGDASAAESAELHLPLRRGAPLGDHLRRVAVLRAEIALLRAEDHRLAQQREVLRQREQLQQRSSALDAAVQKARERLEVGAEPSPARRRGSVLAWMHAHQDSYSDCGISSDGDSGSRGGSLVSSGNSDRGGSGSGGGSRSGPQRSAHVLFRALTRAHRPSSFRASTRRPYRLMPSCRAHSNLRRPIFHHHGACLRRSQRRLQHVSRISIVARVHCRRRTHPHRRRSSKRVSERVNRRRTHPGS